MKLRIVSVVAVALMTMSISAFAANGTAKNGAQIFQSQHCVMCHGMNGKGYPAIHTPDFTSQKWQAAHSDAEMTQVITDGKKGTQMPAFGSKLDVSQIQDLVHYIRSLGKAQKQ
ncbi:MAG: c-type cytochrome [Terriglobia bacterium]